MSKEYFVYILASRSRNLYTGVTRDLIRRMVERRGGLVPGFTSRYRIFRLVHFEAYGDVREAIDREKEIEGGGVKRKAGSSSATIRHGRIWPRNCPTFSVRWGVKSRSLTSVRQRQATGFGMTSVCRVTKGRRPGFRLRQRIQSKFLHREVSSIVGQERAVFFDGDCRNQSVRERQSFAAFCPGIFETPGEPRRPLA